MFFEPRWPDHEWFVPYVCPHTRTLRTWDFLLEFEVVELDDEFEPGDVLCRVKGYPRAVRASYDWQGDGFNNFIRPSRRYI